MTLSNGRCLRQTLTSRLSLLYILVLFVIDFNWKYTFAMTIIPAWMDRPALVWQDTRQFISGGDVEDASADNNEPPAATCVYWEPQEWHSQTTTESKLLCAHYRELLSTAAVTVACLRRDLDREYEKTNQEVGADSTTGIPIVVAIPEGPWLPLAVLVVHALNRPFGSMAKKQYAMLVPLEPSEAMERNRRILQDIQPRLVLCVSGRGENDGLSKDMDRVEKMIESLSGSSCQVLNFATYVTQALELQNVSPSFAEEFYDSLGNVEDNWTLQDWVADAADFIAAQDGRTNTSSCATITTSNSNESRISHIVYTSGTTGMPKGCVSSIQSLQHYLQVKNQVYDINSDSTVLLASALSFDPCLSDILATFDAKAHLALAPRSRLLDSLATILRQLEITHVLCTPTLWGMVNAPSSALPALQVVALGGEPIPKLLRRQWARKRPKKNNDPEGCRLFATYGVTEACVYQTAGEIFLDDDATLGSTGQYVGVPFRGTSIRLCQENNPSALQDVAPGETGEVVLSGSQLDSWTSYWKRPELAIKFVAETDDDGVLKYHYRTGDRGIVDAVSGTLRILGRIDGEEGMVKVNGVRIELGEIEAAIVDDYNVSSTSGLSVPPVVVESCMVQVNQDTDDASSNRSEVVAYCVVSEKALSELELPSKDKIPKTGLLLTGGILLTLLRARCAQSLKAACIPNTYVLLPNLPLSSTGKRDRRKLPPLSECSTTEQGKGKSILLSDYGPLGKFLAGALSESLNLQPLQQEVLTTDVTLEMLGGDSLAAIRISRAVYAWHHQVDNTRYLGGEYGKFDGPFDVIHLLQAKSLGDYVDMLEKHNIAPHGEMGGERDLETATGDDDNDEQHAANSKEKPRNALFEALLQATTKDLSSVAIALVYAGADPNYGDHGKRLGKVGGGFFHRKFAFHSSPLHLACTQGDDRLVQHLIYKGAKFKSPDAAGLYPLHLAASSMDGLPDEDSRRLRCVQYLLEAGAPIVMKDGNQQTLLHAAARSGHASILRHVMTTWKETGTETLKKAWDKPFVDWKDRWHRTPVHWAVLNGRIEALQILLELGCNPTPFKPKVGKSTSAAVEYPMELCDRLYPLDDDCAAVDHAKREMGRVIRQLLNDAIAKRRLSEVNESTPNESESANRPH